jgi:hypothetical protein
MSGARSARLPDGRLHLQHGPIDLVIEAFGAPDEVVRAYDQATARFRRCPETLRTNWRCHARSATLIPCLQGPSRG